MNFPGRNAEMVRMYLEDKANFREIGDAFGVTRQRAAQIVRGRTLDKHRSSLWLQKHNLKILAAFERVQAGESTVEAEAAALEILPHSLRSNWGTKGLYLPRKETPLHGSRYRYNRGCRCAACRESVKLYQRTLIGREPPRHGTASAYTNYACRCDACRRAGSENNRRYKERRRLREESRLLHGVSAS